MRYRLVETRKSVDWPYQYTLNDLAKHVDELIKLYGSETQIEFDAGANNISVDVLLKTQTPIPKRELVAELESMKNETARAKIALRTSEVGLAKRQKEIEKLEKELAKYEEES